MSEQNAEAYHVLGQLNEGLDESEGELRKLRDQAAQEHASLLEQQKEAEEMQDEAALERLGPLLDQAQQAWIVANEELGDDETEDDQAEEENDDAEV